MTGKPHVTVSLDADIVIELMVLSGIRNAQDAVHAAVLDYLAKAKRTQARTGTVGEDPRAPSPDRLNPEGP